MQLINYRRMTVDDLGLIDEIFAKLGRWKSPDFAINFEDRVKSVNSIHLIGELNRQIVSIGSLLLVENIRGLLIGYLEDLYVHPDYRGLGYGRDLVAQLRSLANSKNCRKVLLLSEESNFGFYDKLNAKAVGRAFRFDL